MICWRILGADTLPVSLSILSTRGTSTTSTDGGIISSSSLLLPPNMTCPGCILYPILLPLVSLSLLLSVLLLAVTLDRFLFLRFEDSLPAVVSMLLDSDSELKLYVLKLLMV